MVLAHLRHFKRIAAAVLTTGLISGCLSRTDDPVIANRGAVPFAAFMAQAAGIGPDRSDEAAAAEQTATAASAATQPTPATPPPVTPTREAPTREAAAAQRVADMRARLMNRRAGLLSVASAAQPQGGHDPTAATAPRSMERGSEARPQRQTPPVAAPKSTPRRIPAADRQTRPQPSRAAPAQPQAQSAAPRQQPQPRRRTQRRTAAIFGLWVRLLEAKAVNAPLEPAARRLRAAAGETVTRRLANRYWRGVEGAPQLRDVARALYAANGETPPGPPTLPNSSAADTVRARVETLRQRVDARSP